MVAEEGILVVQIGEPGRSVELVVLDADNSPARVQRACALAFAATGTAWVTVATDHLDASCDQLRVAGLEIKGDPESLMAISLSEHPLTPPGPFLVESDHESSVVVARALIDGIVVASGRMAVVGTDAVADRIETDPAYRRRGLGRAVMAALAAGAVEKGATRGVLGASSDGRALYESLGWIVATELAIARSL